MPTYSQRVTAANDGRFTFTATGVWVGNGNTVALDVDNARYLGRFTGVDVAPEAVIDSAVLTITTTNTSTSSAQGTSVVVADVDDAPTPGSGVYTSSTAWSGEVGPLSGGERAYDVTALVQGIVNRGGWGSGNALAFAARRTSTGTPAIYARDHSTLGDANAAVLTIEWHASVQYLTVAAPVAAVAALPAIEGVEYSIRVAAPVAGVAALPVPNVIAPVRLAVTAPVAATAALPAPTISGTGTAPALVVAAPVTGHARVPIPALAVTVPEPAPPPPWEITVTSPAYLAALVTRTPVRDTRAEVINEDGAILARLGGDDATHPGVLEGTITCDSTRSIRWGCDLTINNPDLLPRTPYDLLHPLSHNRVRVWWRTRLADGTWVEVPVGTFYPDLPDHSDSGAGVEFRLLGSDAVAEIKRATWDTALDLGGLSIDQAVATILTDRAPWVKTALTPSTDKVPAAFEPGEPGGDPWDDIQALAAAGDMVAYADRMGVIRLDPRPSVGIPEASFTEGEDTALMELSASMDLDELANKITVASASADVEPPVTGTWQDDDPSSPLWIGHGHLYHRRIENGIVTTQAQANTFAANLGADMAVVTTVSAVVQPHPHLNPGDTVDINRAQAATSGPHTLQAWSLDLAPTGLMSITATTRRRLT